MFSNNILMEVKTIFRYILFSEGINIIIHDLKCLAPKYVCAPMKQLNDELHHKPSMNHIEPLYCKNKVVPKGCGFFQQLIKQ